MIIWLYKYLRKEFKKNTFNKDPHLEILTQFVL